MGRSLYATDRVIPLIDGNNQGFTPALSCSSGALNAISYYYHLKGSIIDGTFVAISAPSAGSCPSTGIKYPLKTGSPSSTSVSLLCHGNDIF